MLWWSSFLSLMRPTSLPSMTMLLMPVPWLIQLDEHWLPASMLFVLMWVWWWWNWRHSSPLARHCSSTDDDSIAMWRWKCTVKSIWSIWVSRHYFCIRHGIEHLRQSAAPNFVCRWCHWRNHQHAHIDALTYRWRACPKYIRTALCSIAIVSATGCSADTCDSSDTTNMSASNFSDRQYIAGTHGVGRRRVVNTVRPANSHTPYTITIAVNTAPADTNRYNLVHHNRIGTEDVMRTHINW